MLTPQKIMSRSAWFCSLGFFVMGISFTDTFLTFAFRRVPFNSFSDVRVIYDLYCTFLIKPMIELLTCKKVHVNSCTDVRVIYDPLTMIGQS